MLFAGTSKTIRKNKRFAKAFKNNKEPAIKTIEPDKEFNKYRYDGRIWDKDTYRWLPILSKQETVLRDDDEEKEHSETDE